MRTPSCLLALLGLPAVRIVHVPVCDEKGNPTGQELDLREDDPLFLVLRREWLRPRSSYPRTRG